MFRPDQFLRNQLNTQPISNLPPAFTPAALQAWSGGGLSPAVLAHLQSYLAMQPAPVWGPYEVHPYLEQYANDFDIQRTTLLLGTFPPNSYLKSITQTRSLASSHQHVSPRGGLDYFYGNMRSLWDAFGLGRNPTLANVRLFLTSHSIAISDVCRGVQRRVFSSADDSDLFNIWMNDQVTRMFAADSKVERFFLQAVRSLI